MSLLVRENALQFHGLPSIKPRLLYSPSLYSQVTVKSLGSVWILMLFLLPS